MNLKDSDIVEAITGRLQDIMYENPQSSEKVKPHPNLIGHFKKIGALNVRKLLEDEKLKLGKNKEEGNKLNIIALN